MDWACRVRLQWSQADWPDTGAPDTAGGRLGAHVAARLEPVTLLQVGTWSASSWDATSAAAWQLAAAATHAYTALDHWLTCLYAVRPVSAVASKG